MLKFKSIYGKTNATTVLEIWEREPHSHPITPSLLQIHFQPTCNKINNNGIFVEC